jgi:predicted CXXCH cytochrome family protein
MPPPGIRRADFAVEYTTRVSGAEAAFYDSGDPKAHYQQYSDHIRSRHYRNPSRLLTCTNCHSPHANSADIAAMDTSGDDNALCTTCHSPAVNPELYPLTDHVADVTGGSVHDDRGPFLCTECHMVPTARSGAALPALEDPPKQYYWNDIASHRMSVTRRAAFPGQPDQPIAFTNACGSPCHDAFLPNTP